jgi:Mg-chelatase subunit ChlD
MGAVTCGDAGEGPRPRVSNGSSGSTSVPQALGGAQGGSSSVAAPPAIPTADQVVNVNVSGSSGGGQPSVTCSAEAREGQRVPLDMYFLVDSSASMADMIQGGTRWSAVSGALVEFLRDPRNSDIGVGLGYFPHVPAGTCVMGDPLCLCLFGSCIPLSPTLASCESADYSSPAVPLSLPANAAPLITDLLARTVNGGTPTRPALEGAMQYLRSWASAHPERKPVMVLATDGEPLGCDRNTPQDVADVAAAAASGSVPIQTFVIGVGRSLQSLHLVAQAGGTNQAFLVEDSNATTALADALERIHGMSVPCDFLIPSTGSDGKRVDPGKVNVKYTPTGALQPTLLGKTHDGAAASCGPEGGWYYDNPAMPTTIRLCPASCQALAGGRLQVEFGCETIVQPLT